MQLLPHIVVMAVLLTGSVEQSVVIDQHKGKSSKDGRVGIRVSYRTGEVQHVYNNSPAKYAGILRGDTVIEVNGVQKDCHAIHGVPGTTVHLRLLRGERTFDLDLTRVERSKLL